MLAEHLADLPAHGEDGVQCGEGVLEDHRDLLAPDILGHHVFGQFQQIDAPELDAPLRHKSRRCVEDPHDRLGANALAAPRLAEDRQRLVLVERVRESVNRSDDSVLDPEFDVQVVDVEQVGLRIKGLAAESVVLLVAVCCHQRSFGSRASRKASPMRMNEKTATLRKAPGKSSR